MIKNLFGGIKMNIYEYAMQMEKDGKKYYRELIQKTNVKGLKSILNMIADDEVKHYKVVEKMKQNAQPQMAETKVLITAKNIFTKMKEKNEKFDSETSQLELYRKVLDIEEKSHDFYSQKAEEIEDDSQKKIFLKLAEEEQKHYYLIDNIIDFITKPENWAESAEFFKYDQY